MNNTQENELLKRACAGESECLEELLENFKPLVSSIARGYFLLGGDNDDLIQEGMIGLYKAVFAYKPDNDASFKTFAALCIRRQVQSALKSDGRVKNQPLNFSIRLNNQGMIIVEGNEGDEDNEEGVFVLSDDLTPEKKLLDKERLEELTHKIIKALSDFELQVLSLYIKGLSYLQIAAKMKVTDKAIDNALTRIKQKLRDLNI